MGWLIIGLLLALAGGLALFTHRSRRRPAADDTLVADLLGPRTGPVPPVPQAPREHAGFPPVPAARPAADRAPQPTAARGPQAAADVSQPQPAADSGPQPAAEGDWLDTQLAWITAWSAKMREQIAPSAAEEAVLPQAGPEPEAAPPAAGGSGVSQLADEGGPAPPSPPPAPQRCTATTAKGSQCRLSARPGESTCAIHARGRTRS